MLLDSKISRKDFLKLLGAGAAAITVGKFLDSSVLRAGTGTSSSVFGQAQAQSGSPAWTNGYLASINPIHAVRLL